jgi:hypothetical protein
MSESDEKTETEGKDEEKRKLPRREWLAGFAAGGVVTAGAALGYESCQVTPRVAYAPDLELSYVKSAIGPLQTTDFVSEGQRRGLLETGIQKGLADDINEYLSTTYQAFVYSELINALPRDLRESDEVRSDVEGMSPLLDQAVADAYYVIGMADEETKKQIDDELRENPDALMDLASGLDDDGSQSGLGIRGRIRLRRASRQLSARLKMQSADELFTEITDQMTRYSERNAEGKADAGFGVSGATQRMVAAYQGSGSASGLSSGRTVGGRADAFRKSETEVEESYLDTASYSELERLRQKEQGLKRGAAGLAGAGAGLMLIGGIAYGVSGAVGGLVPICIGGFLLLLSLFVAAALAGKRRKIRELEERLEPSAKP